ncbi:MAG TPA: hypothetical protein VEL78_01645 [Pyrinomonadaceae bacterium]|nr:hypothetical protein [Pyrinomonadaceae bacterium]
MSTREHNEKKFGNWKQMANGGRQYRLDVSGRFGWSARYIKEVDAEETTLRFWQEIYDGQGNLIEIHEKYPVDSGHQKV